MASAKFLEEALNTNVDESAVNAIVGSLELVTSSGQVVNPHGVNRTLSNGNVGQSSTMNNSAVSDPDKIVSSGGYQPAPQHIITSGVTVNRMQARPNYVGQVTTSQGNLALLHKPQEPLKVVYPQTAQTVTAQAIGNRVIYPAQSLPNRTVALAPFSQNSNQTGAPGSIVTQAVGKPLQIQSPLILKQSTGNPVGIRPNLVTVPMTNAAMGTPIPVDMANKSNVQGVATAQAFTGAGQHGALPANVQILNMRPGAPAQKSVAAVSPRVVIGNPQAIMGARPVGPGITLQALQGFQQGHQGHLLLKTENGQFQLLRVGPPTPQGATHPTQSVRLTTVAAPVPASSAGLTMVAGTTLAVSNPHRPALPAPQPTSAVAQLQQRAPAAAVSALAQKSSVDTLKEKCRKFLSNLLDLSSKEPKAVERNVRILIQELIDMKVEPEAFCARLEKLLDASPQPCLIGFLKKTLPILRQSLVNKELVIEGINPPPAHLVFSNAIVSTSTVQGIQSSVGHPQIPPPLQPNRSLPQNQFSQPSASLALNSGKMSTPLRNVAKPNTQVAGKTFIKVMANMPSSPGPSGANKQFSKDKDKKISGTSFSQPSFADIDKMAGDDDINDVAAMGGVNLAEESQKILRSTEMIGTQIRSCKDEYLASMGPLQTRLKMIAAKHGLEEPGSDVSALLSHALQERLKNLVEKLACVAEHRLDIIKIHPNYEVTQDVKGQLKFLEDLDRVERKRREDYEREILLRAAKSRSKSEDPEQVKLKEKAKEMQRAEMEEMRQREANLTALQAIGPRKKPRISLSQNDSASAADIHMMDTSVGVKNGVGRSAAPLRARMKRVNYRDLLFLLEQEKDTVRSNLLYKCYLK